MITFCVFVCLGGGVIYKWKVTQLVSLFGQWLVRLRLGDWSQAFWITFNVSVRAARTSYMAPFEFESHTGFGGMGATSIVDGAWTGLALMEVKRDLVTGKKEGKIGGLDLWMMASVLFCWKNIWSSMMGGCLVSMLS